MMNRHNDEKVAPYVPGQHAFYFHEGKSKQKDVPVLNEVPCHEDVLGV
jgi:hypothetical protein